MSHLKFFSKAAFLTIFIFSLTGCALLQLPFQLIGGAAKLAGSAAGAAAGVASKYPWWMFL